MKPRSRKRKGPQLNNKPMKTLLSFASVLLLATIGANAGSRSSANYSIPSDTADSGGRRATTPSYVNDGSIGGIGGISTVALPSESARHGYPAQLIDVTNIVISANPTNINENSTRQLAARFGYDDGTVSPLAAAAVSWSVLNGPLSGV